MRGVCAILVRVADDLVNGVVRDGVFLGKFKIEFLDIVLNGRSVDVAGDLDHVADGLLAFIG